MRRGVARRRLTAQARLTEIVDVATRLISERGFWGVALQDVAGECGMTVAGLLHHVGTKEGLLIAVLRHRDAVDVAELDHLKAEHGGYPRAFLDALVERNSRRPEIVRLYAVLGAESLADAHPAYDFFQERTLRTRARIAASLVGFVPQPEALSVQLLALMDGLQLHWLSQLGTFDLKESWRTAADLMLPMTPVSRPSDGPIHPARRSDARAARAAPP